MRDFAHQAHRALEIYLSRGQQALQSARLGDVDRVNELLAQRRAAFHNFRVADAIAAREERPGNYSASAKALWEEIREIDAELVGEIYQIRDQLAAQVAKVADHRKKMNCYKSGNARFTKLETPV